MVGNQWLGRRGFFWGFGGNIPPNTYSAALARGLPSKGEMRRATIHEQYDVGTGERLGKARKAERTGSASRTGDYGTGGANGRLGKAERTGTSGTGETSEMGEQKKLPLVRQLNFLLYTNYLIIHHLHQSSLKTL